MTNYIYLYSKAFPFPSVHDYLSKFFKGFLFKNRKITKLKKYTFK